jgi:hypothetical protein
MRLASSLIHIGYFSVRKKAACDENVSSMQILNFIFPVELLTISVDKFVRNPTVQAQSIDY